LVSNSVNWENDLSDKVNHEVLLDEARVYEAVLDNLPHDRFALEKLRTIYLACEEIDKANECEKKLMLLEVGALSPDDYHQPQSLMSRTTGFFHKHSKINDLIENCSNPEIMFFESRADIWMDRRPQVALLLQMREEGFLDTEAYLKLCQKLKLANKSNDHLWKGIVSHFQECDRLSYDSLLESMQKQSGMKYVDLSQFKTSKELEVLPKKLISHCELIIFSISKSEVSVAMLNPFNEKVKQLLKEYFTLPVKFYLTDVQSFNTFVKGR